MRFIDSDNDVFKIAITGHRPNKLGGDYDLKSPLLLAIKAKLQGIINENRPTHLISGMALGIDTVWASLAIENNIKLIAAIPCLEHDKKWTPESKKLYHEILNHILTTVVIVSPRPYDDGCMQIRNEWMVNNCNIIVAVWDGTKGGTHNCVKYARSMKKEIITVDPKEIKHD